VATMLSVLSWIPILVADISVYEVHNTIRTSCTYKWKLKWYANINFRRRHLCTKNLHDCGPGFCEQFDMEMDSQHS
jgi:hypothetical protein